MKLKRPESGLSASNRRIKEEIYYADEMDSFLSQIAKKLKEARRLKLEASEIERAFRLNKFVIPDNCISAGKRYIKQENLKIHRDEITKRADAIEEEVIRSLQGSSDVVQKPDMIKELRGDGK